MTAQELYLQYRTILNKTVSGDINIDEFATLFNTAQIELIKQLYSNIAQYNSQGKSVPSDGDNKRVMSALEPFKKVIMLALNKGIAKYDKDADFILGPTIVTATGYTSICDGTPVETVMRSVVQWLDDNEFDRRCNSYIDYPKRKKPVGRFAGNGNVEIAPQVISHVEFRYYRKPRPIYVGRTSGIGGRPVPDNTDPNNVNPEWHDSEIGAILLKCLQYSGVVLDDQSLIQFGLTKENQVT
jgi:hypothetical protein